MHPTFFFILYFSIAHNIMNIWIGSIVVMKFVEISLKLNMMDKIDKNRPIEKIIPINMDITPTLSYINVLLYSSGFFFGIIT